MSDESPSEPEGNFLDKWVFPYLRERGLWPVAAAIIGHASVLLAVVLLETVRSLNPLSTAALFLLLGLMGRAVYEERTKTGRFGTLTLLIAIVSAVSVVVAWTLDYSKLY